MKRDSCIVQYYNSTTIMIVCKDIIDNHAVFDFTNKSCFTPCDQPELAILDLRALLQPLVVDTGARDARDVQQASQLHCHLFTRAQSFLDALGRTVNHLLHNFSCVAVGGWFFTVEGSRVAKKGG